jgi:hypothetical protein
MERERVTQRWTESRHHENREVSCAELLLLLVVVVMLAAAAEAEQEAPSPAHHTAIVAHLLDEGDESADEVSDIEGGDDQHGQPPVLSQQLGGIGRLDLQHLVAVGMHACMPAGSEGERGDSRSAKVEPWGAPHHITTAATPPRNLRTRA